jgi:hypothetical protein
MIDFNLPIRTKRSGRRMYVVGYDHGWARLDFQKDAHWSAGTLYGADGQPISEDCPLGPVENFEDSPFTAIIDVKEEAMERLRVEAVERFNDKVVEELGDHELFGLF